LFFAQCILILLYNIKMRYILSLILYAVYRVIYKVIMLFRVTKSRIMRWADHVARMGKKRGIYRVLVGKPEGKRPLGKPRLK